MNTETVEKIYNIFETSINLLTSEMEIDYLDAFIETGDNLLSGQVQVEDGLPSEKTVKELEKIYNQFNAVTYKPEEIRQAIQLVMIAANKKEQIQANHQFTPEAIGMLFNYVIDSLNYGKEKVSIFDPVVGTGNLLATILNNFKQKNIPYTAVGVDNDDTMLSIASMAFALEKVEVELFHQDSIDNLLVSEADLAIADLPVGYYPIDSRVANFETRNETGHSFVHHLLIEQSMNAVKEGGYGLFLVPSNLFQTNEAKKLLGYFHNKMYLQAILNLPTAMFKDAKAQKSILILQKQGQNAKQAEPVLLGEFPDFKSQDKMLSFLSDFKKWSKQNLH